jgi:hypothetical protein
LAETDDTWSEDAMVAGDGHDAWMAELALAGSVALVSGAYWDDEAASRKAGRRLQAWN